MIQLVINIAILISVWIGIYLCVTFNTERVKTRDNEFYTDYRKGNLVMRIFKYEDEFQAVGNIKRGKLMDTGNLTINYKWALIDISK